MAGPYSVMIVGRWPSRNNISCMTQELQRLCKVWYYVKRCLKHAKICYTAWQIHWEIHWTQFWTITQKNRRGWYCLNLSWWNRKNSIWYMRTDTGDPNKMQSRWVQVQLITLPYCGVVCERTANGLWMAWVSTTFCPVSSHLDASCCR